MNKALLDRTPLWEIRPEEQVIPDINSLQVDNSREQAKLYYEANKVEIWANTLQEKDKEIERLNNIIIIMEKYFELIIDLGYDYDGLSNTKDLQNLIDELVRYASLGRVCNTTEAIYVNQDKKYNILNEELKGDNK